MTENNISDLGVGPLSMDTQSNFRSQATDEKSGSLVKLEAQRSVSKRLYGLNKRTKNSLEKQDPRNNKLILDPIREQVLKERDEDLLNMFEQRKSQRESL